MTAEITATRERSRAGNARRRAAASLLLVSAIWASLAIAVALFLFSGGLVEFDTAANAVTSVGIVAGLLGTDVVLVMLVLAARAPFIDHAVGHDRAIALHRFLGKPALYLLLGHGALLLTGYGMTAGINPAAEIGPMFAIPDMPLAFIGMGLLITVVVTSLVAVRRRFSYESWQLIHLLSYVAVLFAVPHQLSVGGIFADNPFERAYWSTLYFFAFGMIVVFRFIEPVLSSIRHRLRVESVETIAAGVVSITLSGRKLALLDSVGGQFFVWRFWTPQTWWHSHPISLSAMATDSRLRITVRSYGRGSERISSVVAGTRVWFEGPYGVFTAASRTKEKLAIAVAGIGVTPVRAMLEESNFAPGEVTLLLRASTSAETYLWYEVLQLATDKGITVFTMIGSRATTGAGWMPQEDGDRGVSLTSVFPDLLDSDLYLCGPRAWLDLVETDARSAGLPARQLHSERFDR